MINLNFLWGSMFYSSSEVLLMIIWHGKIGTSTFYSGSVSRRQFKNSKTITATRHETVVTMKAWPGARNTTTSRYVRLINSPPRSDVLGWKPCIARTGVNFSLGTSLLLTYAVTPVGRKFKINIATRRGTRKRLISKIRRNKFVNLDGGRTENEKKKKNRRKKKPIYFVGPETSKYGFPGTIIPRGVVLLSQFALQHTNYYTAVVCRSPVFRIFDAKCK